MAVSATTAGSLEHFRMTTEDALLASIIANPDDDLPRLVYADWLDETGDPAKAARAEFIRVQVEMGTAKGRRKKSLSVRSAALLAGPKPHIYEHEVIWFNSGNGTDTWRMLFRPVWRRGFVETVRCTLADWCGGECDQCGGWGDGPEMITHCPACNGTNRIPGIGPQIVRRHPVTKVVLTDTVIVPYEQDGLFYVASTVAPLPFTVGSSFQSLEDGEKALYTAAIAWAKSQTPHLAATPVSADLTR